MEKKRMRIGILLVAGALMVMTVLVVMFYPKEEKASPPEQQAKRSEESQKQEERASKPAAGSVAGKCFGNGEEKFYFYTEKYVVIKAIGRDEFGGTFEQRNWYTYIIRDGRLELKNGEDSFSCPVSWEDGGIEIDGALYSEKKMTVQGGNDLIWHTYERGGQNSDCKISKKFHDFRIFQHCSSIRNQSGVRRYTGGL